MISFLILSTSYVTASKLEDKQIYIKIITKGLQQYAYGQYYEGYAESDYDDASYMYEEGDYEWGEYYADSADVYYGYASGCYRIAKEYFEESLQYAINEKLRRLSQTFIDYLELMSQITSEMHEACEYFSSACNYYSLGYYDTGDSAIETMNIHIVNHDSLINECNNNYGEIESILDNFYISEEDIITEENSYTTLVLVAFIFCISGLVVGRISKRQIKGTSIATGKTAYANKIQHQSTEQKIIKCWNCGKRYFNYREVCPYCKQASNKILCPNCKNKFGFISNPYGVTQVTCPNCSYTRIISGY